MLVPSCSHPQKAVGYLFPELFRLVPGGSRRWLIIHLLFPSSCLHLSKQPVFQSNLCPLLSTHAIILLPFLLSTTLIMCLCFRPVFLPATEQMHSCGPGGVHTGPCVLSCERALPEDNQLHPQKPSPPETFLKTLSPPPLLKTSCFTELFPASVAVKFHNFPLKSLLQLLESVCVG